MYSLLSLLRYSKHYSKIITIIWWLLFLGTLQTFEQSLLNFLLALTKMNLADISLFFQFFSLGVIEIVRLFLSGWLMFTVFVRPGTTKLIPEPSIREQPEETTRAVTLFLGVEVLRVFLSGGIVILFDLPLVSQIRWRIMWAISGFISSLIILRQAVQTIKRLLHEHRIAPEQKILEQMYHVSVVQRSALNKLSTLSWDERKELSILLYEKERIEKINIPDIARSLGYGFIVALLFALLEEVFSKL